MFYYYYYLPDVYNKQYKTLFKKKLLEKKLHLNFNTKTKSK